MRGRDEDLIGLRDEDLTAQERGSRARWLLSNPALRQEHDAVTQLASVLRDELPVQSSLTASDVLVRARGDVAPQRASRRWAQGMSGVAIAAVALLWIQGGGSEVRDRALQMPPPGEVHLEAVAESASGLRALGPGAVVGADEQVVFRARTTSEGHLTLIELGAGGARVVYPVPDVDWRVGVGEHVVGGERPLGYRPDDRAGELDYRIVLCRQPLQDPNLFPSGCGIDAMMISWEVGD